MDVNSKDEKTKKEHVFHIHNLKRRLLH